jgi:hypothetical protein
MQNNGGEILTCITKLMEQYDWMGKSDITPQWSERRCQ